MKKSLIFFSAVVVLALMVSLTVYLFIRGGGSKVEGPSADGRAASGGEREVESKAEKEEVILFFPTMEGYLKRQLREIEKKGSPEQKAMEILSQLKVPPSGALSPFPPGGDIRRVFIINGEAVVDVILPGQGFGSQYELLTVYSLVDSLTYNLEAVDKVKIVVGGMERKTLFGHVSLKYPFFQDLSYAEE